MQLDYMLELFYCDKVILDNMNNKSHQFLLAKEDSNFLGFASYEHQSTGKNLTRLHKLYVLPDAQMKGIGKLLMDLVETAAGQNNSDIISLNVNRFNKASQFYLKNGFKIVGEEDIALEHGYLMEDYKMEKRLEIFTQL